MLLPLYTEYYVLQRRRKGKEIMSAWLLRIESFPIKVQNWRAWYEIHLPPNHLTLAMERKSSFLAVIEQRNFSSFLLEAKWLIRKRKWIWKILSYGYYLSYKVDRFVLEILRKRKINEHESIPVGCQMTLCLYIEVQVELGIDRSSTGRSYVLVGWV